MGLFVEITMASEFTFGQALNEAKQIILQQSNRIKADAEKTKSLQQTIADQGATITQLEGQLRQQTDIVEAKTQEITALQARWQEETTARAQAEGVIDRQGQRITSLQAAGSDLESQLAQLSQQLNQVTVQRDALTAQVPSPEDEQALAAMTTLLSQRDARTKTTSMRIGAASDIQAQAA